MSKGCVKACVVRGHGEQGEMIYLLLMCSEEINLRFSKVKPELVRVDFRNRAGSSCTVFCFIIIFFFNKSESTVIFFLKCINEGHGLGNLYLTMVL